MDTKKHICTGSHTCKVLHRIIFEGYVLICSHCFFYTTYYILCLYSCFSLRLTILTALSTTL